MFSTINNIENKPSQHKNMTKRKHSSSMHGFSLIEMAVVLMILGILLSGILAAVGRSADNARRITTRNQLEQVTEALYGFAQTNGRLPCPATSTSGGYEDPIGGGVCTSFHGFIPVTTLDFHGSINTDGLILDAWQNPLRYSVDNTNTGSGRAFTTSAGLNDYFNTSSIVGDTLLRVCDINTCAGLIHSNSSPAVIVSMGENWATTTTANELENAAEATDAQGYQIANDSDFVVTTYSEDNYDDIVVWLSPHVLFSKMIKAGQLP